MIEVLYEEEEPEMISFIYIRGFEIVYPSREWATRQEHMSVTPYSQFMAGLHYFLHI